MRHPWLVAGDADLSPVALVGHARLSVIDDEQLVWAGAVELRLNDGHVIQPGSSEFCTFGGPRRGLSRMHGLWDWGSMGEHAFEELDAVYELRREDVVGALTEWATTRIWSDRPPPPLEILQRRAARLGLVFEASDLEKLPLTIEVDPSLERVLWVGEHPILDKLIPMAPTDVRVNMGSGEITLPLLRDRPS